MFRKIFVTVFFLVTLILIGCGNNAEKIIIGIDDKFAPMGFRDDKNNIVGFDVDLAKETAKRMGVDIEFKSIDWVNKREEITSGNIDIIWNGLDIVEEDKEYMIFSKPYMDNRQILLIKQGNPHNIYALGDLEGKVVGTQAGSNSETYINENPNIKNAFKEFKTYHDIKEGFDGLEQNKFDVLIIDEIAARYELIKNPGTFKIIEATVGSITQFAIGFRKDDVELRDRVQTAFDSMLDDSTARQISEKWFQADLIKYIR